MNLEEFLKFFANAKVIFEDNLNELSRLDSVLGDGDHGLSMLKGFKCIESEIEKQFFNSVSDLLSVAGRSLMKEIGGSCGPLFATIFLQGAMVTKGKDSINTSDFAAMMRKSADMIMTIGKAKPGEKTMIDALIPAAEALEQCAADGIDVYEALKISAKAAEDGAEKTKGMIATKGRGRYQGEKSLGNIDPGAKSVSYIFKALSDVKG